MSEYVYTVRTNDVYGDALFATRHEAVGEKAILDAIHEGTSFRSAIGVRKRYATDPVPEVELEHCAPDTIETSHY